MGLISTSLLEQLSRNQFGFLHPSFHLHVHRPEHTYLYPYRSGDKQIWKLLNDCLPLWQRDGPPQAPTNSSHVQHEAPPPATASKDTPAPKVSSSSRPKTSTFEYSPVASALPSSTRNALLLANYAALDRAGYQVGKDHMV